MMTKFRNKKQLASHLINNGVQCSERETRKALDRKYINAILKVERQTTAKHPAKSFKESRSNAVKHAVSNVNASVDMFVGERGDSS